MPTSEPRYDYFISYSNADRAWVEGVLLDALPADVTVIHEDAFSLGAPRLGEFERAVRESRRVLLVISTAYLADEVSGFVDLLTQQYGLDAGTWPVIPLLREAVDGLPTRLGMLVSLPATTADETEVAIERLLADLQQTPQGTTKPPCPYPGMRTYRTEESRYFFGRSAQIEQLRLRLRKEALILIVGPSGSGKSSLALAGLAPRLGEDGWQAVPIRPGAQPDLALRAALADIMDLDAGARVAGNDGPVLVIIDQLEELFTLTADEAKRQHFVTDLLRMTKVPDLKIVLTMRADFFGDLMQSEILWPAVRDHRLEIETLDDDNLREAIDRPADRVRVYVEPALVERLVADAAGEKGMLPFVQETLVLLWDKLERRFLPLHAYEAMVLPEKAYAGENGLLVAMGVHADAAYAELITDERKALARRIFLRLIQFGEGREDTRRQQPEQALRAVGDDAGEFDAVLTHLVDKRLLTTSDADRSGERKVDLAHEALIRGWPKLRTWIQQAREAEIVRRRLEEQAADWLESGKRSGLLNDYELQEAESWLAGADAAELGVSEALSALIAASAARLQQQRRAKRRNQILTVVAVVVIVGVTLGALINNNIRTAREREILATNAIALGLEQAETSKQRGLAVGQRIAAEEEARSARAAEYRAQRAQFSAEEATLKIEALGRRIYANSLAIQSELMQTTNAQVGLLLGIEAVEVTRARDEPVTDQAQENLRQTVTRVSANRWRETLPTHRHTKDVNSVAYSPDGTRILTASGDQSARVWDAATGRQQLLLIGHAGEVTDAAFSPDGATIATVGEDKTLRFWDAVTGIPICRFPDGDGGRTTALTDQPAGASNSACHTVIHDEAVRSVAFHPDGRTLLTASKDGTARVWAVEDGRKLLELVHDGGWILAASFRPDGVQIVTTGADQTARLWDAASGELHAILAHDLWVRNAAFTPDNGRLVTVSAGGEVRAWDVATGTELPPFAPHVFPPESSAQDVNDVAFSPDSKYAVTVAFQGQVLLRDAETGEVLVSHPGHHRNVVSVAFSPDGDHFVTSATDDTARVWRLGSRQPLLTIGDHAGSTRAAVFSPDGENLVTASSDNTVRLWDLASSSVITTMVAHTDTVRALVYSPDGERLATGGEDGRVQIWTFDAAKPLRPLTRYTDTVTSIAFSPDGQRLAVAGDFPTVDIWHVRSGRVVKRLAGHTDTVRAVTYSSDGAALITGSDDGTVRWWDAARGVETDQLMVDPEGVRALAVANDDEIIAYADHSRSVTLWDTIAGEALIQLDGHTDIVNALAFSPDDTTIVTGSDDETATVWDARTGERLQQLAGHESEIRAIAFSPDGRTIATGDGAGAARLWDVGALPTENEFIGHDSLVRYADFSPDDDLLVTAGEDRGPIIWDVRSGAVITQLIGHDRGVWTAEFAPDGEKVLTASQDGTIRMWNVVSGTDSISVTIGVPVNFAAFHPSGEQFITTSADGLARLWDTETMTVTQVYTGHRQPVLYAELSPDNRYLATASADHTARLWNVRNGAEVQQFRGHGDWIWSVDFSPDGERLVTSGGDGTARIWDLTTGEELVVLRGHGGLVRTAHFSPDGAHILTAGEDHTARLWDAESGTEIRQFTGHADDVWYAGFSHDGGLIVTTSFDKTVRLWDATTIEGTLARARALIQRDPPLFTVDERTSLLGEP